MAEYDRDRIVESMFDPVTSEILAELEDQEQECSHLAQKAGITEPEVLQRLSYLVECGFVMCHTRHDTCVISANHQMLNRIVEDADNFDGAISGLEKMDSYLN